MCYRVEEAQPVPVLRTQRMRKHAAFSGVPKRGLCTPGVPHIPVEAAPRQRAGRGPVWRSQTLVERFRSLFPNTYITFANARKRLKPPFLHYMNHEERECLQCGGLVEGRANKRFCSAACRAQHFRDTQEEPRSDGEIFPSSAIARVAAPQWSAEQPPATHVEPQGAVASWLVEYQRGETFRREAEKARRVAAQCDLLHSQFTKVVTDCLKAEGTSLDKWALERKMADLDQLSTSYRSHPDLQKLGTRVYDRLEDAYWLHDKFRDLLNELKSQYRPGYPGTILVDFTAKCRARLRASLLPD